MNATLSLLDNQLTKFKRFFGLDTSSISGYLYLVNLALVGRNTKSYSRVVVNLKVTVEITAEENKLDNEQLEQLLISNSKLKHPGCFLSYSVSKISFMRICPIYRDITGQESV